MPRGGRRNVGHQSQQPPQGFTGPPPGLDHPGHFQQQFDELTGNPLIDFAPPGFSAQPQFYGAPPPGLEMQFHPSVNLPPPLFMPELQESIQAMHIGDPVETEQEEQLPSNSQRVGSQQPKPSSSRNNRGQQTHRGVPFKGPIEECILCCQRSDIFGIGPCRHPACIECVIRMRCLGESVTCHACREEIILMSFVQKPKKWDDYKTPECKVIHPDCEKYAIAFENQHAADVYNALNAFSCHVCQRQGSFAEFPSFAALKQHMGTAHQLFFCHICLDHLNVLPKNHRTFTKKDLQLHMTGARNAVKGVNGHPKCDFCALRFFDTEELYKHSRKEHFYCGICAQVQGTNCFFKTIKQLHFHYKQKHYPCLDSECVELGIVFNDEFDLNVHKTERHSEGNRSIPVDFQFARTQSRYNEPPARVATQRQGVSVIPSNHPPPPQPTNIIPSAQTTGRNVQLVQRPTIVQQHDFPTLAASSNTSTAFPSNTNWRAEVSAAHFPTLSGPTSSSAGAAAKTNIWSGGKAVAIVKKPPKPRDPSIPKPTRRRIIVSPEVWTENMRLKMEAREKGLPEPEDIEPKLPEPPAGGTFKKKEKKPKKKTVGLEALKKKLNEPTLLTTQNTASKFDILAGRD